MMGKGSVDLLLVFQIANNACQKGMQDHNSLAFTLYLEKIY